ncbi:hypothetical protein JJV70_02500 [Streptomyces sp. JJ66]|uniref:DUF6879 family protein n=1 Tax=Streptomyces sp. JJ66 TaxID=2803843 RepID=UPI001C5957E8|nr:DUF6879 family protein [Streptomyces sp. JJ66]MBW1600992.1 hypothetical protein [Streptomyces sp. JJ66]
MTRRVRIVGTNSGNDGCPTLYQIDGTDTYLVQGDAVTDPGEFAQLRGLKDHEAAVTVPRALLATFGPKTAEHVPQMISFPELSRMLGTLEHSAWRLETRRRYASDEETDTWAEFQRTGTVNWDLEDAWCLSRREQAARGVRVERVRVQDDPLTEGQRYLLDNARRNEAVGETIRTLSRATAQKLRLPEEDFWLIDSRVVALLHFDGDDEITGVELITDPVDVLRYCQFREAAWHYAASSNRAQR